MKVRRCSRISREKCKLSFLLRAKVTLNISTMTRCFSFQCFKINVTWSVLYVKYKPLQQASKLFPLWGKGKKYKRRPFDFNFFFSSPSNFFIFFAALFCPTQQLKVTVASLENGKIKNPSRQFYVLISEDSQCSL